MLILRRIKWKTNKHAATPHGLFFVLTLLVLFFPSAPISWPMVFSVFQSEIETRLPGAVPQPLFLILIVFGCIIFFEGRLPFSKNWGCLLFPNILLLFILIVFVCIFVLRSSYIFKEIEVVFLFQNKIEVVFQFQKYWGRLPYFF